jgi:hypothetical protein
METPSQLAQNCSALLQAGVAHHYAAQVQQAVSTPAWGAQGTQTGEGAWDSAGHTTEAAFGQSLPLSGQASGTGWGAAQGVPTGGGAWNAAVQAPAAGGPAWSAWHTEWGGVNTRSDEALTQPSSNSQGWYQRALAQANGADECIMRGGIPTYSDYRGFVCEGLPSVSQTGQSLCPPGSVHRVTNGLAGCYYTHTSSNTTS